MRQRTFDLAVLAAVVLVGPLTIRKLLTAYGDDPVAVLKIGPRSLSDIEGVTGRRAEAIAAFSDTDRLKRNIEAASKDGTRIVAYDEDGYPRELKEVLGEDAPLVLYIKGELVPSDRYAIAMVGSRLCSNYGLQMANTISRDLAGMGITVVSGLARGIDTVSHNAALAQGGRSIGVMGSGIDVIYPAENKKLVERMAGSGAVITEFAPGTPPMPENFPRRNRIISALSLGVLVVEAAERSGALITARFALEQGREVFAMPGNVNSRTSGGTNLLIRNGARAVTKASDIIEELAPVLRDFIKSERKCTIPLSEDESLLCGVLSAEPMHIDSISRAGGTNPARVSALLLGLELKGVVRQLPGMMFYLDT